MPQVWRLPQTPFLESDPIPDATLTNADNDYTGLDSFALLLMIDTDTF